MGKYRSMILVASAANMDSYYSTPAHPVLCSSAGVYYADPGFPHPPGQDPHRFRPSHYAGLTYTFLPICLAVATSTKSWDFPFCSAPSWWRPCSSVFVAFVLPYIRSKFLPAHRDGGTIIVSIGISCFHRRLQPGRRSGRSPTMGQLHQLADRRPGHRGDRGLLRLLGMGQRRGRAHRHRGWLAGGRGDRLCGLQQHRLRQVV